MSNIKAWRVGDSISTVVYSKLFQRNGIFDMRETVKGRVIARYPDVRQLDIVDLKGHVWRVNYG